MTRILLLADISDLPFVQNNDGQFLVSTSVISFYSSAME